MITLGPVLLAMVLASAIYRNVVGPRPWQRGPTIATPRAHLSEWIERHNKNVGRAMAGPIPLLFLGDSITQGWLGPSITSDGRSARPIWEERFASRRAENFGFDGDHIEHLLWRIRHGELADAEPNVIVLLIGTNNIGLDPPEVIAEGVVAVVDEIHRRSPSTVVILMGLLPRGEVLGHGQPAISNRPDPRIAEINRLIAPLGNRARVTFLDIGDRLLDDDGRVNRDIQPDLLHLATDAYQTWADAIEPTIRLLLGPPPEPEDRDPSLLPEPPAG